MERFHPDSPFDISTASDASWTIAEGWIRGCIRDHKVCAAVADSSPWYPTRLVKISADSIKLIETSEEAPISPYVTLSHCWGTSQFLTLKQSNLHEFKESIGSDNLPKTFQDAVTIAERLKINYIWIDSLCIIQDSEDDWLREASLMHKVYSNGYCNIAATGARDSSHGLFVERDIRRLQPYTIDIRWRSRGVTFFEVVFWEMWKQQLADAPLNQRAWVVQERLLAPRVLHFGQQQLLFECCEFDACEQYPRGLPPALGNTAYAGFKGLDPNVDGIRLRKLSGAAVTSDMYGLELWNKIISAYSAALLTYSEDKLIALSGIAKRMQPTVQADYIAGLWNLHLASQLTWTVEGDPPSQCDGSPAKRPEKWRAPSFSWMSVDGVISAPNPRSNGLLAEVVEVHVEPYTSDRTGLLKSGYLRIRGRLEALKLRRWKLGARQWIMSLNNIDMLVSGVPQWEQLAGLVHLDIEQNGFPNPLYYMNILAEDDYLTGLVLELIDQPAGTFRRIGCFASTKPDGIKLLLAEHPTSDDMPCESYDPETREHTIRII